MTRRAFRIGAASFALWATTAFPAFAADDPLVFEGAGYGHGIGMSQYGSFARALDGQGYEEILASYYAGTTVAMLGVDGVPLPDLIFTNVASDDDAATITIEDGPGDGNTPTVVTRGVDTVDMYPGDSVLIEDLDEAAGAGGCVASFDLAASDEPIVWDSGSCDVSFSLAPSTALPDNVVSVDECRTTYCRFAWGESFQLVDNYSSQRSHPDYGWGGFDQVVASTLDDYTLGLAESIFSWGRTEEGMNALRTQAVAARSYAATFAGPISHTSTGCFCDIRNNSSYQVYGGWLGPTSVTLGRAMWENWDQAARDTTGEIVWRSGASSGGAWGGVIRAFYSSSNGGASENNEDIWNGSPVPWLRSVDDPWSISSSSGNPLRSWTVTGSTSILESKLNLDEVNTVEIAERYVSGTPSRIVVTGQRDGATVTVDAHDGEPMDGVLFDAWFGLWSPHIDSISSDLPDPPPVTDTARWSGVDRYATAADVSRKNFPSGAEAVIVATGLNYPDALAAASLAAKIDAPVLLVQGGEVPASTLNEVERLAPSKIYILGGTAAVPSSAQNVLDDVAPVARLAGADRYETAVKISQATHSGAVDTLYIAPGTSFADPLAAGPVAASSGSALLLVEPTRIQSVVRSEIQRLSPETIVVIGGGGIISSSVVNELMAYADTVTSLAGSNRYHTSVLVSQHGFASAGTVLIATGTIFPDALSGSGVAGDLQAPILLVEPNALPPVVASELVRLNPSVVRVLGGPAAISDSVVQEIIDLLD